MFVLRIAVATGNGTNMTVFQKTNRWWRSDREVQVGSMAREAREGVYEGIGEVSEGGLEPP
jgi:hypothetical protein